LYPVGTPEFAETAAGWVRYALRACQLARAAGIEAFDVEIWNELSFGSNFTAINHYYKPPLIKAPKDSLREGGPAWELARQTVAAVKKENPQARCIWGFSNTTFYHTPIEKLPAGIDGQSYHPYGTGVRKLPAQETHRDHPEYNLDGRTPTLEIRMPEGWAHTFIQTECLMRLLNPAARQKHPGFRHYMTEHGVAPPECGVKDADGAWELKAKCALRSFCFWLNKGVDVMEYYCAYDREPTGMGLMSGDTVTPPLKAMRNLTQAFAGSVPLARTVPLQVEVSALGEPREIFPGLKRSDVFAALPFQVNERKFIIAAYVMSYDVMAPSSDESYRLTVKGLPEGKFKAQWYDPLRAETLPIKVVETKSGSVTVKLPVRDWPRLLVLTTES
jgi:hypothetical protein